MAKTKLQSTLHQPLIAIFGTRAKVAVLRILWQARQPLPYREVVRRAGMAYGSIDLALGELTTVGLVEEIAGGRERRVRLRTTHRLAASVSATLQAEADFFPALRVAIIATLQPLVADGLLAAAIVGAAARRDEIPGAPIDVVLIGRDMALRQRWETHLTAANDTLLQRFGVTLHVIAYDEATARAMWRKRAPGAVDSVRTADRLVGASLADWLASA
jgi:DNA-binding transcriptional ArsR family regulator